MILALALAAQLVATPATFPATFLAAQAGDSITLMPGDYGSVVLRNSAYSPRVSLYLGGATLSGLYVDSSGLDIYGGAITPSTIRGGVYVSGAHDVHLHGLTVTDPTGEYTGVVFRNASNVSLEASTLTGQFVTMQLIDSDYVDVLGNTYSDFTRDGITSASSSHVNVIGNTCRVTKPTLNGHPDCGQFWSALNDPKTSDYVVVSHNRAEGYAQGFDDFGSAAVGHLTIEFNETHLVFPQALAIYKAAAGVIRYNHVSTMAPAPGVTIPGLSVSTINTPAAGVVRCGNVVDPGGGKKGLVDPSCPGAAP